MIQLRRWLVVEADLNPVVGSEQGGRRPVLIVSNDEFNEVVSNVTVLPLTARERVAYPAEVCLPAGAAGQPRQSLVMAHQIRTISKARLGRGYGYLNDPSLRTAVEAAIKEHLDILDQP